MTKIVSREEALGMVPTGHLKLTLPETLLVLSEPESARPKVYAYFFDGPLAGKVGQINSLAMYHRNALDIQFCWTPQLESIEELIKRSRR